MITPFYFGVFNFTLIFFRKGDTVKANRSAFPEKVTLALSCRVLLEELSMDSLEYGCWLCFLFLFVLCSPMFVILKCFYCAWSVCWIT